MSTPLHARAATEAPTVPQGRAARALDRLAHPWQALRDASLAQRFLLANLVILLVAGLAIGVWVGDQLERSIIDRTASVTALYVESIIEPSVASLANGDELTSDEIAQLDSHLAASAFSEPVRSLRIWAPDGRIVYSPDAELIGRTFPVEGGLADAWSGRLVAGMDDLSGEENTWERARWSRLLELYVPVRQRGSDRIIAVAEFYLSPRETIGQVGDARRTTWLVVTLAIVASAALLYGIVKRGSDTIQRQEQALTHQVDELSGLLEQNAELNERVLSAAERSTTLNERSMRRVSADLHDGPGQMLSLALLRLDGLQKRADQGEPPTPAELAEVDEVLREAMTDMRSVAAGLRVPELGPMTIEAVATRAVHDHGRRSGAEVSLQARSLPAEAPLPVKIALFRALQESLSNATRHSGQGGMSVDLSGTPATRDRNLGLAGLLLVVRDAGAGFDPGTLGESEGLGLAGIREQAEILGGSFAIRSAPGAGTEVRVWWPLQNVTGDA
jgi:signal transduction histidine kinase